MIGVESREFLLGGAVAAERGIGFVAVRKSGALFLGAKLRRTAGSDYRSREHELLMRRDALSPADRTILVDDWAETGSKRSPSPRWCGSGAPSWSGCR